MGRQCGLLASANEIERIPNLQNPTGDRQSDTGDGETMARIKPMSAEQKPLEVKITFEKLYTVRSDRGTTTETGVNPSDIELRDPVLRIKINGQWEVFPLN